MDEQKTYTINGNEYIADQCMEQFEAAAAVIAESGIEIDFEKDSEEVVQQKLSQFVGFLIRTKRTGEFLAYVLKPKNADWSADKINDYIKDFKKEKAFNFTLIVGSFFLQIMQIYSGHFAGLKQSTDVNAPPNEESKA